MSVEPDSPKENGEQTQSQPLNPVDVSRTSTKREMDSDSDTDQIESQIQPGNSISRSSTKSSSKSIIFRGAKIVMPNWHKLKPNKLSKTELLSLFNEVVKERVILTGTSRDSPHDQFIKLRSLYQQAPESPIKSKHRSLQILKAEFTKDVPTKVWDHFSKKYIKEYKPESFNIDEIQVNYSQMPRSFQFLNGRQSTSGLQQTTQIQSDKQQISETNNKQDSINNDHNKNKKRDLTVIIDSDDEMSEDDDLEIIPKDPKKQVFPYKASKFMKIDPSNLNKYTQIWSHYANTFIKEYKNEREFKSESELNMKKSNIIHQLIKYLSYHHMVITDKIIDKISEFYSKCPIAKIIYNINNLWQTTYKDFITEKVINNKGERVKPFKWTLTIPKKTSKRSIINVFADPEQYEKRKKKKRKTESPYSDDSEMTPFDSTFYQNNYNESHPSKTDIVRNLQQDMDELRKMQDVLERKIRKETNTNKLSIREMLETPKRGLTAVGIDKERGKDFATKISELIDDDGSSFKLKGVVDAMNASSNSDIAQSLQSMYCVPL